MRSQFSVPPFRFPIRILALLLVIGASAAVGRGLMSASQQAAAGQASRASYTSLPRDVFPESRNRLPLIKREEMDEDGKKVYDETVGDTRRIAGLKGPDGIQGIRLYSPRVAAAARSLNGYLQRDTGLEPRVTELAILITARELDQVFEWNAHEILSLKAGLDQQLIDLIKYRKPLTGLAEKDAVVIRLGREIFEKKKVDSDTYASALKLFGKKGLVDIVSLMGLYSWTAALLDTFDQQLLSGQKPLLPVP